MSPADGRGHRPAGRAATEAKRGSKQPDPPLRAPGGASVQMTIESSYTDARQVQRLIRDEIERAGFDTDGQFAIKLALEEALINAIKHGNKLDKSKHVHVEWTITPRAAEIIIEDEGPGFDRRTVPDCTKGSNLEKLTGRGILLIETYMHTVEYTKGGRRVRLVRENQADLRGIKTA